MKRPDEEINPKKDAPQDSEGSKESTNELKFSVFQTWHAQDACNSLTYSQLEEMAANPAQTIPNPQGMTDDEIKAQKDRLRVFIPSDCSVKGKADLLRHNRYVLLIGDVDRHIEKPSLWLF